MRFGCWGLIIAIGLTWHGGQKTYEAWNSSELNSRTFDQLVIENPQVGWYELTDAKWILGDANLVVSEKGDVPNGEMYIPINDPKQPEGGKVQIVLHRTNLEEANAVKGALDARAEGKDLDPAIEKNLMTARPVKGMIEFGIDSDDNIRDEMKRQMGDELAENYVVISDGAEPPGYGYSILFLIGGILLGLVSLGGFAFADEE